jgi:menaquinone-9 beta-reductase
LKEPQFDIAIIGGGPAGSTAAIYLARMNFRVCIIEKKQFPRETLCGEFLSREVFQILHELYLSDGFLALNPNTLTSFRISTEFSHSYAAELPFTAYGLKRGTFDSFLLDNARMAGALVYQPNTVEAIHHIQGGYDVVLTPHEGTEHITARYVIAAQGKSLSLDKTLQRTHRKNRSRLNGIKFHIHKKYLPNVPEHEIQIYTGPDLYCGVNVVNDNTVTLCFLEERSSGAAKPRARIVELMKTNRYFARAVSAELENKLSSLPIYGSGDIHFGKNNLVEDGIFMLGDAGQVIAPLAGDGIGMAMESAKIIAFVLDKGRRETLDGDALSSLYRERWRSNFRRRIRIANNIQRLLLSQFGKKIGGVILEGIPSLLASAIDYTRG